MNAQSAAWNNPPPSYTQATAPGAYHQAPPNYYSAPQTMYGWMPPSYNFPAPQAGTIFINDAPPPYPGMAPQGQYYQQPPAANGFGYPQQEYAAYPPQQPPMTAAPPAGFAYPPQNGYAYANGNQAFVPASASAPPPTYDEASKKTN